MRRACHRGHTFITNSPVSSLCVYLLILFFSLSKRKIEFKESFPWDELSLFESCVLPRPSQRGLIKLRRRAEGTRSHHSDIREGFENFHRARKPIWGEQNVAIGIG